MNTATGNIETEREIAQRINGWHAQVELHRVACSEAVYGGLYAAWQAGQLLPCSKAQSCTRQLAALAREAFQRNHTHCPTLHGAGKERA